MKSTGYEGAYGNRTVITLRDGTDIWYCHQSRIAVTVGQTVDPGEVIGYTGSTGNVTGPHLHLEVHPHGGGPVDPCRSCASTASTPDRLRLNPHPTVRVGVRTPSAPSAASELFDRGVAQQQALDALRAEVDRGDGLVALALDRDDGAEAEAVVADPVARLDSDTTSRGRPLGPAATLDDAERRLGRRRG